MGFYPSVARLVGKFLLHPCKEWEHKYAKQGVWSISKGRRPSDAVWRQAVTAEGATADRQHVVTIPWVLRVSTITSTIMFLRR